MVKKLTIKKSALIPTVLISGGAGFVGSHLAELLLEKKARVIVVDNFDTGKEIFVNHLVKNPNFALFNCDINNGLPADIESVDYIFHLAGLEEYLYNRSFLNLNTLLTNSMGTKNLLDLAKKSNAKFLLASTIDVYLGKMSQLDLDEYFGKTSLEENKFSLTEAKRFAEAVVWEYYKKYNVDARIVRLPEIYGPRMSLDSSGCLGSFLKDIIEGKNISIYGDGNEKEFYVYVKDAVSGLIKALFDPSTTGIIYSLVHDPAVSVLETAYLVKKLADGKVDVLYKPSREQIVDYSRMPDDFSLKGLSWKPKIGMQDGIIKTLEFFGYSANTNSFKPAKFVEQKNAKNLYTISSSVTPKKPKILDHKSKFVKISAKPTIKKSPTGKFVKVVSPKPVKKTTKINLKMPAVSLPKIPKIKLPKIPKLPKQVVMGIAVFLSALVVFIGVPLVSTAFHGMKATKSINKIQNSVSSLDSENITKEAKDLTVHLEKAKKSLNGQYWIWKLVGKKDNYKALNLSLSSTIHFSKSLESLATAIEPLESVLTVLRPDSSDSLDINKFNASKLDISTAKQEIKLARVDYSYVVSGDLPKKFSGKFEEYGSYLTLVEENLDLASSLMSDLPSILGMAGERKYIVWFQNSNEIRPTGGFIGSYALVTLDNGKIKDLKIDDIYNPDGQIDVRDIVVEPPAQIAEYLEEDRWYLRNSNWNPDFPTSAEDFDDLYYRVTGEQMDGYIALDLHFVEKILEKMGPIYLAVYDEEISSENLYERSQFHSGYNYEEGSSSKKSFLTNLGSKILERLFALESTEYANIGLGVVEGLESGSLMIYLRNSAFSQSLNEKGWDGSLVSTEGDYLQIVNANLGGTKANYFVKNKYDYEISSMTRDGLLRATLTLNYTHTGTDNAWPGGPYKDYVRVLVQEGANLTGAQITFGSGEAQDIFENVVSNKLGEYQTFEYGFTLNPSNSVKLVLNYDLASELSLDVDRRNYSLYWEKQPGTLDDDYSFVFRPPFGMNVLSNSNELVRGENSLGNSGKISKDINYFISFD